MWIKPGPRGTVYDANSSTWATPDAAKPGAARGTAQQEEPVMVQPKSRPIRFAAIGLDHRHIYEMASRLLELGGECVGYWTEGEPQPLAGFVKRFPDIPRVADKRRLLEDPTVQMILTAAIPADRAAIAIEAMRAGKDVATDKPGCTTADQLAALRRTAAETGAQTRPSRSGGTTRYRPAGPAPRGSGHTPRDSPEPPTNACRRTSPRPCDRPRGTDRTALASPCHAPRV